MEEVYWRQRSRLTWLLKGDANTAFFHAMENGRKRKCAILRLSTDLGVISELQALRAHFYDLHHQLMGSPGEQGMFALRPVTWDVVGWVLEEDDDALMLSFTKQEMDMVLASMRVDTAPGPDGWPVVFFKTFWRLLKPFVLAIANNFALGRVDIAHLNFGILTLIPKVHGADDITLFRPIALINVIFKFVAKAYAIRLSPPLTLPLVLLRRLY
jgi:hypothetical protein